MDWSNICKDSKNPLTLEILSWFPPWILSRVPPEIVPGIPVKIPGSPSEISPEILIRISLDIFWDTSRSFWIPLWIFFRNSSRASYRDSFHRILPVQKLIARFWHVLKRNSTRNFYQQFSRNFSLDYSGTFHEYNQEFLQ